MLREALATAPHSALVRVDWQPDAHGAWSLGADARARATLADPVRLACVPLDRVAIPTPHLKLRARAGYRRARALATERGGFDALLVGGTGADAPWLEATTANLFAVHDGTLRTAPVGEVLPGVVRAFVLARAGELGLAVEERAPCPSWLDGAGEVFLSGSGVGLLPVAGLIAGPCFETGGPAVIALRAALEAHWGAQEGP